MDNLFNIFSKLRRRQDFNRIPEGKNILLEVIVWGEVVGEDAMAFVCLHFFLRTVKRQGAEVTNLLTIDF